MAVGDVLPCGCPFDQVEKCVRPQFACPVHGQTPDEAVQPPVTAVERPTNTVSHHNDSATELPAGTAVVRTSAGVRAADTINHPAHYNTGAIEVIEAIEDWELNYPRGNAVKYIARAGRKDPAKEVEDLEKAIWYLARDVERLRAKKAGRAPARPNDMPIPRRTS